MILREEIGDKFETILKESTSTITKHRSDINEAQKVLPLGSKNRKSIGVRASDKKDKDCPPRASLMRDLIQPVRPMLRNEPDPNEKVLINENPIEEEYHSQIRECMSSGHFYSTTKLLDRQAETRVS